MIQEIFRRCAMEKAKIDRINELAKKKKTTGLTPEEADEQQRLRREYIDEFKGSLKSQLDGIRVVDDEGNKFTAKEFNIKRRDNK